MSQTRQTSSRRQAAGSSAAPTTAARRRRHPFLRLIRFFAGIAIQLVLLVLVLVLLILGTQTGLRTAVGIAEGLFPETIRVEEVQGRVLGWLHLGGVELHLPGVDLALASVDLNWSPLALVGGTLRVRALTASGIDLVLAPSEEEAPAEPFELPNVVLPLSVQIDSALVERLSVSEAGAAAPIVELERARLRARMQGSELRLERLEAVLAQPALSAEASGQANLVDGYPLGVDLGWTLELPPGAMLQGRGRVGGDLAGLVVEHEITGSARLRLDAHVQNLLEQPSWDGQVELEGVDLPDFAVDAPAIELTASIRTSGDLEQAVATGTLEGKAIDLPDFGHLEAALDLRWSGQVLTLRTLELTEAVSGARLGLAGEMDLGQEAGHFEADGTWEKLRWPLSGELLAASPKGELHVAGAFDAYDYEVSAGAEGPSFPALELGVQGKGSLDATRIGVLKLSTLDGTIAGNGDVAWSPDIAWHLVLNGDGLNPGVFVEGLDDAVDLSLASEGGLDGYGFGLGAVTSGPGLPPTHLALSGRGDLKSAEIVNLVLVGLGGRVEGHGMTAWDPQLGWEAELHAWDIDPAGLAPDWPGRISGKARSEGTLGADGPDLSAVIDGVEGQLRGYPVSVAGRVEMAGGKVALDGIEASSGPTRAQVQGSASLDDESLDLAFDLASPDLASLVPEGRGSFEAKGAVTGTFTAPQVQLELSAHDAEIAGQGIGSLQGKVDVGITPEGPFQIELGGTNLIAGGMRFDSLSVEGSGGMPRHRLIAAVAGPDLNAKVELDGALSDDFSYKGQVGTLQLDYPPFGTWGLERAVPLELAMPKVSAGPLCIRNASGSGGCLSFDQRESGKWSASVDLDRLGTDLVAGLLPENLVAEGGATVKGRFDADGAVLDGGLTANIPQGLIRVAIGPGQDEVLDFSGTRLRLDAAAKGLSADLGVPLKTLGRVSASAELPGWRLDDPARSDQPLRGRVQARVDGLTRISGMLPDLTGVTGAIDADLRLGGVLKSPDIQGAIRGRDLGGEVPLIGLKVSGLNIDLAATRDRLTLDGRGDVGGGQLTMDGKLRVAPGGVVGRITAGGDRLKVADTNEYFALASPSFAVDLEPSAVHVSGEVVVPEARIRTRTIPSGTVSASGDVVMEAPTEQKPGLPLDIDVKLRLGKEVTIDSFGVRGRLTGEIRAFQTAGQEMLGDGQLSIVDGTYRISGFGIAAELGKPLTIAQGRLIWAKSPIGNPGILLQAKREGSGTSATVQVQGTLRKQEMSFFSDADPGMSQAEVAKYVLTGVPPKSDTQSEDSGLAVGTYVAPNLFMEYEPALGDQKDTLRLRYEINRHFELQTETGENQGGDIFYKFEN